MPSGLTMDTRALGAALTEFAALTREGLGPVVLDEARILYTDAMNLTPPWGKGKRKGSSKAAELQGRNAIERSILNSFKPITEDSAISQAQDELIRNNDVDGMNEYLRNVGVAETKAKVVRFSSATHKADRSRKSGRVHRSRGRYVIGSDAQRLHAYTKEQQSKVGTFKAAFAWMVLALSAHPKSKTKSRIPGWVKKNLARGSRLILRQSIIIRKQGATVIFDVMGHDQLSFSFARAVRAREAGLRKKIRLIADGNAKKVNTKFALR